MKDFRYRLGNKTYERLWNIADDVIGRIELLSEVYDNVPEELQDVDISVLELHIFPEDKKEEVLEWLNRSKKGRGL